MTKTANLNVHVVFALLFTLSVLSPPVNYPYINVLMVVLTLILVLLFAGKILLDNGFVWIFFKKYKIEIVLIFSYAAVSFLSMLIHYDAFFGSWFNFLFYGLSPIAIWCSMPFMWLIFRYSGNDQKFYFWWFGWAIFVILALVGIWQAFDFQGAKIITQYFVAGDRLNLDDGNISSLTRISTDFGVIMAFAIVCCLMCLDDSDAKYKVVMGCMAILFLFAGFLSGSRNFLLVLGVATILFVITNLKDKYVQICYALLISGTVLLTVAWFNDDVAQRFSVIFPFLSKLHTPSEIVWRDLVFVFGNSDFDSSNRTLIWGFVIQSLQDDFWIGPSLRGFNIVLGTSGHSSGVGSITTSAHNLFFQSLVDGGIVGFCIIIGLIYRLVLRSIKTGCLMIFLIVLSSMMIDYYLDHSLPWMLCAAWCLNIHQFKHVLKESKG